MPGQPRLTKKSILLMFKYFVVIFFTTEKNLNLYFSHMLPSTNSEVRETHFKVYLQNTSVRMKNIFVFHNF